ncbi:MAG: helix-turn-helix domain-containing protein, partial [Longimicrobiaceae bacterium]
MYDYDRIERAIAYFDERFQEQPSVAEVARQAGLSESHFHRLFHHWAGITPKRFLEYVTAAHARRMLEESATVLETAWDSGLSGPSRLHDLFITLEGVTPGEIQRRGGGLAMRYGFHHSPFGECLVAETDRGVTALSFVPEGGRDHALEELAQQWPEAELERDEATTGKTLERILA